MVVVSSSMMWTIAIVGVFAWILVGVVCDCVKECKRLEVTHNTIEDKEERNNVK